MSVTKELLLSFNQSCDRRVVCGLYGVSIPIIDCIWDKYLSELPGIKPIYLLWVLFFFKNYATEEVTCTFFAVSPKTYRSKVIFFPYFFLLLLFFHSISIFSFGLLFIIFLTTWRKSFGKKFFYPLCLFFGLQGYVSIFSFNHSFINSFLFQNFVAIDSTTCPIQVF